MSVAGHNVQGLQESPTAGVDGRTRGDHGVVSPRLNSQQCSDHEQHRLHVTHPSEEGHSEQRKTPAVPNHVVACRVGRLRGDSLREKRDDVVMIVSKSCEQHRDCDGTTPPEIPAWPMGKHQICIRITITVVRHPSLRLIASHSASYSDSSQHVACLSRDPS